MIVYIGAGVLAWTAAQMMFHEPLLEPLIGQYHLIPAIACTVITGGVLFSALMAERQRKRRA